MAGKNGVGQSMKSTATQVFSEISPILGGEPEQYRRVKTLMFVLIGIEFFYVPSPPLRRGAGRPQCGSAAGRGLRCEREPAPRGRHGATTGHAPAGPAQRRAAAGGWLPAGADRRRAAGRAAG